MSERLEKITGHLLLLSSSSTSKEDKKSSNHLVIRALESTDYDKGYMSLLSQLTKVGNVSKTQFLAQLQRMKESGAYHTAVIEDTNKRLIIATATLLVENKFIHQCGCMGHVEDVVTREDYRGQRLGFRVVEQLLHWAKEVGCYKVILDCSKKNVPFYEKLGFKEKECQMVVYM